MPLLRMPAGGLLVSNIFYNHKEEFNNLNFNPCAVRQLEAYPFPLNIRELRTMVERAAAQAGAEHEQEIPRELFWQTTQVGLRILNRV